MEGPISFRGYKEQKSNLILPEHDDDDINSRTSAERIIVRVPEQFICRNLCL